MKLPWVSRSFHEAEVADWCARFDAERDAHVKLLHAVAEALAAKPVASSPPTLTLSTASPPPNVRSRGGVEDGNNGTTIGPTTVDHSQDGVSLILDHHTSRKAAETAYLAVGKYLHRNGRSFSSSEVSLEDFLAANPAYRRDDKSGNIVDLGGRVVPCTSSIRFVSFRETVSERETKQEPRERSVIANAIRDNAAGDPRLAAHFRGLARKLHLEGMGDEQIALEIGNWSTTEPSEETG